MGRHEAVWNNYKCKIDLDGTPDRFQAPPGVESGLQGRLMNQFGVLIVWSDFSLELQFVFIFWKDLLVILVIIIQN